MGHYLATNRRAPLFPVPAEAGYFSATMMFPAIVRQRSDMALIRPLTKRETVWPKSEIGPEERKGIIADDRPGAADERAEAMRRKNGGPGVRPGGVHKRNIAILDVQRELACESDCLRRFYEGMSGDGWEEHASWQKLLVQLRAPDGEPIELDRIANLSKSEIEHYRDELYGVRAKWVDRKKLPMTLTRVIELKLPSNNLVGQLPDW